MAETVAVVKKQSLSPISQFVGLMLKLLVGRKQENKSHLNYKKNLEAFPLHILFDPTLRGIFVLYYSQESQKGIEEQ